MLVMGLDPGLQGGICIRDDESVILEVMPVKDDLIDIQELHRIIRPYAHEITRVFLEMASIRPMQAGQFKIGRGFGRIESVLSYLQLPVTIVMPQDWSKIYDHGVTEKNKSKRYGLIKKARAKIVQKIYPGINFLATNESRVSHSGLVDAALLADFGWNILKPRRGMQ